MGALATELEVRRSTISEALARAGIERRPQREIDEDTVLRAIELYNQGLSLGQIESRLGFSAETIRKQLKQHGIARRPAGRPAS